MRRSFILLMLIPALLLTIVPAAARAQNDLPPGTDIVFVVDQSGSMSRGTIINPRDRRCTPERLPDCPRSAPTDPDGLAIKAIRDGISPIFERMILRSFSRLAGLTHRRGESLWAGAVRRRCDLRGERGYGAAADADRDRARCEWDLAIEYRPAAADDAAQPGRDGLLARVHRRLHAAGLRAAHAAQPQARGGAAHRWPALAGRDRVRHEEPRRATSPSWAAGTPICSAAASCGCWAWIPRISSGRKTRPTGARSRRAAPSA